jgi:hypothetical protein
MEKTFTVELSLAIDIIKHLEGSESKAFAEHQVRHTYFNLDEAQMNMLQELGSKVDSLVNQMLLELKDSKINNI